MILHKSVYQDLTSFDILVHRTDENLKQVLNEFVDKYDDMFYFITCKVVEDFKLNHKEYEDFEYFCSFDLHITYYDPYTILEKLLEIIGQYVRIFVVTSSDQTTLPEKITQLFSKFNLTYETVFEDSYANS
jgi:hypothetical protein